MLQTQLKPNILFNTTIAVQFSCAYVQRKKMEATGSAVASENSIIRFSALAFSAIVTQISPIQSLKLKCSQMKQSSTSSGQ